MKNLRELDAYRIAGNDEIDPEAEGAFHVPSPATASELLVIASTSGGWDHVSVSLPNRCPNWYEMSLVHRTFFRDNEVAMQLHVPPREHINQHEHCLHLWRPNEGVLIPLPDPAMVGLQVDQEKAHRNARALIVWDRDYLRAQLPPIDDATLEIAMHKARAACADVPENLRADSLSWLRERNYKPLQASLPLEAA